MSIPALLDGYGYLASPAIFAILVGASTLLVWLAFAPARATRQVDERLQDYVDRGDVIEISEMNNPLLKRTLIPMLRRLLRFLGRLLPQRAVAETDLLLVRGGRPGNLSALDFVGLRLLLALLLGGGYFVFLGPGQPFFNQVLYAVILAVVGYIFPWWWLKRRVRRRQYEIERALPDALDMMTIGVEAGLAFESAMVRVSAKWDNALSREFTRAVTEMRLGVARSQALQHMVERTGVSTLRSFVAVLNQSTQLGVSIADVLHTQADEMRVKRRQRAEELARKASIKMIFPLAIFIFPSMLVVILGPSVPVFIELFQILGNR